MIAESRRPTLHYTAQPDAPLKLKGGRADSSCSSMPPKGKAKAKAKAQAQAARRATRSGPGAAAAANVAAAEERLKRDYTNRRTNVMKVQRAIDRKLTHVDPTELMKEHSDGLDVLTHHLTFSNFFVA